MAAEADAHVDGCRASKKLRTDPRPSTRCAPADEWRARVDLALCYRACEHFGLHEGVCNHLSLELPDLSGRGRFLLIAYGVHWSRATASDILVLDFDGNVLAGRGKPERTGFVSHRALHRALGPGAAAVLHTHMPSATALTCLRPQLGGRLLPVHQNVLKFQGHVAYDDEWGGLFDDGEADRTTAVAEQFLSEHGRCPRAMMCASHGVFAFGCSVAEAWDNLYYLERLCAVQAQALACAGGDIRRLRLIDETRLQQGQALAEADRPGSIEAHWAAMQGLLRQDPSEYDREDTS